MYLLNLVTLAIKLEKQKSFYKRSKCCYMLKHLEDLTMTNLEQSTTNSNDFWTDIEVNELKERKKTI